MRKLSQAQKEILLEIIEKHHLSEITIDNIDSISVEMKLELAEFLTDEFCATGLREDWEPNPRGLLIEDVIDAVLDYLKE